MEKDKKGVVADEAAEETETTSEQPTETNEDDSETSKPEGASAPEEEERKIKKIPVDYERFNEINREAKLAKRIKSHLGLDEDEIEKLLEQAGEEQEESKSLPPQQNVLNKRLSRIEEVLDNLRQETARQKEVKEWVETLKRNPEIEPFQEQITELGRTGKYRKMSYGDIYNDVFAPAINLAKSKIADKFSAKETAQLHKGKSGETEYVGDLTLEQFAKLPLDKKEKYLRQQKII